LNAVLSADQLVLMAFLFKGIEPQKWWVAVMVAVLFPQ